MATMVANIVTAMVDEPDKVKIQVTEVSSQRFHVELEVAPGDVGLVFGAEYSVFNAITRLVGAASRQQGVNVWLKFDPPGKRPPARK